MFKLKPALICLAFAFLGSSSTFAAISVKGVRYTHYTAKTARCPDGNAKLRHKNAYWCRTYAASLNWTPPVTRTNGKALYASEIKAYEVYWTREKDSAKGTIKNPSKAKSTVFHVWTPDIYHFAIAAVDTTGRKSPLSKVVSTRLGK